ncbi:2-dehydropantoate 2-reductase [Vibrio aestuarianus]|uniref:2-dehydropantoate 2-reductase n=1 Tax=Vibrio aestuarianus TaxID=28171 RepID=A0ABD7YIS4_9VIBR|nr:2-dehydropantoate 2-reductase [Vibrio aestuarianus]WGK84751.1 2-dehydropantoate 2-reductase [Vibrio aestuarianus]CAH8215567.1 putative 2-dehydropantoate 2-reductase [Vibrio aestuarianus]
MNIVVLGPGAIGLLWATQLHQAGHNVSLWGRAPHQHLSIIQDNNLTVSFPYCDSNALKKADLLLITVKAWQVEQALIPLLTQLNRDTILLFMHNGMGAVDNIAALLNKFPLLLATTTHGALKPSINQVLHTGKGVTQLGAYNAKGEQCQFLVDVLAHALPEVVWNNTIEEALWHKLAINCAINPITALEQCRNGDLANQRFQQQLENIVAEVASVMNAEGFSVTPSSLLTKVKQVIQATAVNHSSMHQDIFYQRKTEIDFITGYLLKKAEKHQLSTTENSKLYHAIQQIEHSWESQ